MSARPISTPSTRAGHAPSVLLVSSTLDDDGGVPVCVGHLGAALSGWGVPVTIVGQCIGIPAVAISEGCKTGDVVLHDIRQPWHAAGQWRASRSVRAIVRRAADEARLENRRLVVHLHGVWVAPVQAAAAEALDCGAILVVSPHGMLRREALAKSRWRKRLVWLGALRRTLAMADAIHVTSDAEGADLRAILPGCRPVLVPLGVKPPPDAPRQRSPESPRRAGYLGRLLPIKNLDVLLEAWARASPRGWRLAIDGPGSPEMIVRLRALADRLGIADVVDVGSTVPFDRLGEHFASLDLFILPSRSEAFALVVGEALASGVPALVTDAAPWGGVERERCGWSVRPTVPDLAAAISRATALDVDSLAAMGSRARSWARSEYSWRNVAMRHLIDLYGWCGQVGMESGVRGA